jgi:hypothetical protein
MNVGYLAALAMEAYLDAAGLTTVTNVYAEMEDPTVDEQEVLADLPCVVISSGGAEEFPQFTGNYNFDLIVRVEASADDHTADEVEAMFDEVFSKVSTDTILADLNAAGDDFTAFGFTGGISQTPQVIEGRIRSKSIILPINACPSDIS